MAMQIPGRPRPVRRGPARIITGLVLILPAARSANADVVTLPPNQDTTLYQDSGGSLGNGAGSAMFAGRNSQPANSIRRALLAFDIASAIPPGSVIDGATLRLFNDASNIESQTVELRKINREWGEGASVAGGAQGGGAPAAPGDATWLYAFYNTGTWTSPGGDFASAASASALIGGAGAHLWTSTAALTADVQGLLDHPETNYGWALVGNETAAGSAKRFATREATDPNVRPLLTITYTPVPEPATIAGFAAGALWLVRRILRRPGF